MHMLTPAQMRTLVAHAETAGLSERAMERLGWIAHFVENGYSMADTCAAFHISRSTFHRWLTRFDPNDLQSLEERTHEPHAVRVPSVPSEVVERIRSLRIETPNVSKERIAEILHEAGVHISPSSVGRVIERECLYFGDTPLHWKKRMRSHASPVPAEMQHACAHCAHRMNVWRRVAKGALIASVVANIALLGFLAFYGLRGDTRDHRTVDASVLLTPRRVP